LTLSWSPSTALIGTVSYLVSERGFCSGRGGCSYLAIAQVSATTLKITGLTAGSHIYFVTAPTSAGSTSVKSAGLGVVTLQPAPPTNLSVTKVTQVSVSLFWTASVGPVPIVGYRVYDIDLSTNLTILRVDAITGTSAAVTNLGSNTRHLLRVVAYDASFNLSPVLAGNQVDVTTNSLPSIFHPPAFINPLGLGAFPEQIVGVVGQSLMVISAAAHMTAGQNYVLGTGGLPKPTLSVLSGPAGMVIDNLTGLVSWNPVNAVPGNYSATIRTSNTEGSTNFVFNYTVYPAGTDLLSPTGVLGLSITNITRSGALVTWTTATDNKGVAGYNVLAQTTGVRNAPTGPLVKVGTTTGTSFTITTLTPATTYVIYVQAFDAAGNSGATGPSYISTSL
jgi:chitodextrinase